ncbi:hypothetical protein, partial [Amycolatopsis magusensis]|uniref:hypothetical protein n=1 Tax=Amycolatopsis magusensis TaxID=882444 RepID=UPI0024A97AC4
ELAISHSADYRGVGALFTSLTFDASKCAQGAARKWREGNHHGKENEARGTPTGDYGEPYWHTARITTGDSFR